MQSPQSWVLVCLGSSSWQLGRFSSLSLMERLYLSSISSSRQRRTASTMYSTLSNMLSQQMIWALPSEGSRMQLGLTMIRQNQCLKALMGRTRQFISKMLILRVHLCTFLQFSFTFLLISPTMQDDSRSNDMSSRTYSPSSFYMKNEEKKKHLFSRLEGRKTKLNTLRQLPTMVSLRSASGFNFSISSMDMGKVSVFSPTLMVNWSLLIRISLLLKIFQVSLRLELISFSWSPLCLRNNSSFRLEVNWFIFRLAIFSSRLSSMSKYGILSKMERAASPFCTALRSSLSGSATISSCSSWIRYFSVSMFSRVEIRASETRWRARTVSCTSLSLDSLMNNCRQINYKLLYRPPPYKISQLHKSQLHFEIFLFNSTPANMHPRPHTPTPTQNTSKEIFVRGTLQQKLKVVIGKICQGGKKNNDELREIIAKIAPAITKTQQSTELAILEYLLTQAPDLKERSEMAQKSLEVFTMFFRAISIVIIPPLYLELEALLQKVYEPLEKSLQVPNLWNQSKGILDCYCQLSEEKNSEIICYKCQKTYHESCFWSKKDDRYYECPLCFVKHCLPQKSVQKIIFLGYLEYLPLEHAEYTMKFHANKNEFCSLYKYQFRCIELTDQNRYSLTFPPHCTIKLGNKVVRQIGDQPGTNNYRNNQEVSVDKHFLTQSNLNFLTVQVHNKQEEIGMAASKRNNYLIAVVSVKQFSNVPQLLEEKYSLSVLTKLKAKNMIKRVTNSTNQDSVTVQFRCQYFSTIIATPVRSKQCTSHYQPFDLHNFILISLTFPDSSLSWHCPICKVRAYDLIVDQNLEDLIEKNKNIFKATFDKEGELKSLEKEGEPEVIAIDQKDASPKKSTPQKNGSMENEKSMEGEDNYKEVRSHRMKRTYEDRQLEENEMFEMIEMTPRKVERRQYQYVKTNKKAEPFTQSQLQAFTERVKSLINAKSSNSIRMRRNPDLKVSQATEDSIKSRDKKNITNEIFENLNQGKNQPTLQHISIPAAIADSSVEESVQIMESNNLEGVLLQDHQRQLKELGKNLKKGGMTAQEKTSFSILTRKLEGISWQ